MFDKESQLKWNKEKKVSTFGKKRSLIKKKAKKIKPLADDVDLFDRTITLRFSSNEVKKRVIWLKDNIGYCQCCGSRCNPDYPHHALDGTGRKDDRTMVDICTVCHSAIHMKGFDSLPTSEEELIEKSWNNNKLYLRS